jgi:multicomponent Na+:H+ antiporter subunit G
VIDLFAGALILCGAFFFFAGTVGLLRFPDALTRLHALTKADTLGLGLIVIALILRADSWAVRLKLLVIWLLVLGATATTCHMIARSQLDRGTPGGRP